MIAPITVLVVDDEPLARCGLRDLVSARGDCAVVGVAADGADACRAMLDTRPQVVLLDVELPDMDGFATLRAARDAGLAPLPAVVFITAHGSYAIDAFRVPALDYLLKPFTDEQFAEALDRACAAVRTAPAAPRVVLRSHDRVVVVDPHDVDWVEADSYYAKLHVAGAVHVVRESLTSLESRLGAERFVRVHRSALVNLDRVREIGRDAIRLSTGAQVPLARERRRTLIARFAR